MEKTVLLSALTTYVAFGFNRASISFNAIFSDLCAFSKLNSSALCYADTVKELI